MPSPRVGLLFLALSTSAWVAHAEPASPSASPAVKRSVTSDQEVRADDLALGKPTTNTLPPPSTPSNAPQIVAPELAQSATVAPKQSARPTPPSVATSEPLVEPEEGPKRLPYKGEAEMPGYQLEEQRRWWMIGLGGALFGVGYVAGIGVGADRDFRNGFGFTAIPIAGPWVALAMRNDECTPSLSCSNDSDDALAAAGVLQAIGGIGLAIGLVSTRQVWVRKDVAWTLAPLFGRQGTGLQVRGAF